MQYGAMQPCNIRQMWAEVCALFMTAVLPDVLWVATAKVQQRIQFRLLQEKYHHVLAKSKLQMHFGDPPEQSQLQQQRPFHRTSCGRKCYHEQTVLHICLWLANSIHPHVQSNTLDKHSASINEHPAQQANLQMPTSPSKPARRMHCKPAYCGPKMYAR